jgi:hypothetical protein
MRAWLAQDTSLTNWSGSTKADRTGRRSLAPAPTNGPPRKQGARGSQPAADEEASIMGDKRLIGRACQIPDAFRGM